MHVSNTECPVKIVFFSDVSKKEDKNQFSYEGKRVEERKRHDFFFFYLRPKFCLTLCCYYGGSFF